MRAGDVSEDGITRTLAEVAAAFRASDPDLYAKVDAIRADPNRIERGHVADPRMMMGEIPAFECPWCGDWFTTYGRSSVSGAEVPSCSRSCATSYFYWKRRRSA